MLINPLNSQQQQQQHNSLMMTSNPLSSASSSSSLSSTSSSASISSSKSILIQDVDNNSIDMINNNMDEIIIPNGIVNLDNHIDHKSIKLSQINNNIVDPLSSITNTPQTTTTTKTKSTKIMNEKLLTNKESILLRFVYNILMICYMKRKILLSSLISWVFLLTKTP